MGQVDNIYLSKLNELQNIMNERLSKAGLSSDSFAGILQTSKEQYKTDELTSTNDYQNQTLSGSEIL